MRIIAAAELDDVQQFFRQYYTPNNASLAIVGDFDPAAARALVEKYFGRLKRGPDVPKITATTPPITAEKKLTVTDTVQLPRVYMSWLTPAIFKPGDAEADLTADILGGGKSSRLYKSLVYDKQIAQSITASQESLILGSKFTIQATARPGHTAEELEAAINDGASNARWQSGPEARELERAQNTHQARIIEGLETLGGFGGKADRLNSYEHYLGNPDYLRQDLQRYRGATADRRSRRLRRSYLQPNSRVVVFAVPARRSCRRSRPPADGASRARRGAQSVNADEPWRQTMPKPDPSRRRSCQMPERFMLPNGLTVIVSEQRELPVVSASLVFPAAAVTTRLTCQGSPTSPPRCSTRELRRETPSGSPTMRRGWGRRSRPGRRWTVQVAVTSLAPQFAAALDLMADVALHPTFPADGDRAAAGEPAGEPRRRRRAILRQIVATRDGRRAVRSGAPVRLRELGTEASNKA